MTTATDQHLDAIRRSKTEVRDAVIAWASSAAPDIPIKSVMALVADIERRLEHSIGDAFIRGQTASN